MLKLILLLTWFCAVQGGHGATCYWTEYSWWYDSYYTTSFYCDHGCCGASGYQFCCADDNDDHGKDSKHDDDDDHHYKGGWTVASIVGVSIGGLVAVLIVIFISLCIVKMCKASNKKVVNVRPYPMNTGVWSTSAGPSTSMQTFTQGQPPVYTPIGGYQSQPPTYHPPPGRAGYDFTEEKQSHL